MTDTLLSILAGLEDSLAEFATDGSGPVCASLRWLSGYCCGAMWAGGGRPTLNDWVDDIHKLRESFEFDLRNGRPVGATLAEVRRVLKPLLDQAAEARKQLEAVA